MDEDRDWNASLAIVFLIACILLSRRFRQERSKDSLARQNEIDPIEFTPEERQQIRDSLKASLNRTPEEAEALAWRIRGNLSRERVSRPRGKYSPAESPNGH